MSLTRADQTVADVVDLDEMKAHLRVLEDDEDTLIADYVAGAVGHLDGPHGYLGRCLIAQSWAETFEGWSVVIVLGLSDVSNVVVTYKDATGADATVPVASYSVVQDPRGARVVFNSAFVWPALEDENPEPVTVTFKAGFGDDPADVPAPLRQAVRLLAAHFYQNREAVVTGTITATLPLGVQMLCAPFRRVLI